MVRIGHQMDEKKVGKGKGMGKLIREKKEDKQKMISRAQTSVNCLS